MADGLAGLEAFKKDVFDALDLKTQRKALRGAMRKEATRVRKAVKSAITASDLGKGTRADVTKGVYQRVYPAKYGAGFMVSVKTSGKTGKRGIHTNRAGKQKPVLMWAAEGTQMRRVGKRTGRKYSTSWTGKRYATYGRSGHSTGRMRKYGFMDKAEAQVEGSVEANLWAAFNANLDKAVRRIGN